MLKCLDKFLQGVSTSVHTLMRPQILNYDVIWAAIDWVGYTRIKMFDWFFFLSLVSRVRLIFSLSRYHMLVLYSSINLWFPLNSRNVFVVSSQVINKTARWYVIFFSTFRLSINHVLAFRHRLKWLRYVVVVVVVFNV